MMFSRWLRSHHERGQGMAVEGSFPERQIFFNEGSFLPFGLW